MGRRKSIYNGLEGGSQTEKSAAMILQTEPPNELINDLRHTHYVLNPEDAKQISYYDIRQQILTLKRLGPPRYTSGQIAAGKVCSCCGKMKPRTPSSYHRNTYSPDGYHSKCKVCRKL
jgi:hypothetical protein